LLCFALLLFCFSLFYVLSFYKKDTKRNKQKKQEQGKKTNKEKKQENA